VLPKQDFVVWAAVSLAGFAGPEFKKLPGQMAWQQKSVPQ
jgi:hypothetical protein